ncbi:MAG: polyamine aminopropyltransferase [Erysipelotrichaceae bacterium]|nr:polyamine aminopropyltransferase [Erysipelotrichaceae bacterium]
MEYWFTEEHSDNVRFSIRTNKQLASVETEIQRVDVFDTPEFGKILVMDGNVTMTEKDEFIYHDMIVHVPMAVNPNIKRVLVIGAGDGGTIRELCRYPMIESIDMVEIDEAVVDICKEHFKTTSYALNDPRVKIYFEDGLRFVRSNKKVYDLVLVDSTDPIGPSEGLFSREFYGNCFNALKDDGILVNQHESPYYDFNVKAIQKSIKRLREKFPIGKMYQAHIPTFSSGYWLFGFASKKYDPVEDLDEEAFNRLGLYTKYYNTDLHKGSFALPNYVKELLNYDIK